MAFNADQLESELNRIDRAIVNVRDCHLEDLRDVVADALDEVREALSTFADLMEEAVGDSQNE